MSSRIINLTCPNCKHGIKHDTLMGKTTGIAPEDYPEKNPEGRYWCKRCQHGTYCNEVGLCEECLNKGIETRLTPESKVDIKEVKPVEVIKEVVKEPEPEKEKELVIEQEKELEIKQEVKQETKQETKSRKKSSV